MSNRRLLSSMLSYCFIISCVFGGAHSLVFADTQRARPNIVLIVIDDLGWSDLACYGSKFYRTPNIDRLAADGMRFTQAYSACPVCSPTRAALMTGKYPARLHLTDWLPGMGDRTTNKLLRPEFRQELPLEETTIAELLHDAGYVTGTIGKWHLGGEGFEPTRQGFGTNVGGDHAGSPLSYFAPYARDDRTMPRLENAPEGEYLTDRLAVEAEKFIEQHQKRPFFLYLPHYAVHTPIKAKADLIAKYRIVASARPGGQNNPVYAAMIDSMDEAVGRVMRKVESLALTENTIIIFTSDNGGLATAEGPDTPSTINAPLREGKGYLYEGGIRVPLVVHWPAQIQASTTCDTPVISYDLFPTIAAICGLAAEKPADGVSILPLLKQARPLAREALYWHYPHYSPQGGKPGGAIREGDFKLIEFYEQGRRELYNVVVDTSESTNLIDQDPGRVERMSAKLSAWRKEIDAQMMRPNPAFTPDTQAPDGTIMLAAKTADIHGVMVRYEPLPHKNTIGFWVREDDWVSWDFQLKSPGEFQMEIVQGCGQGSGGSEVDFTVADQTVRIKVQETGGFQKFVTRRIGTIRLARVGRFTLAVKPRTRAGPAVMDLRQVRLVPVNEAGEKP
jgi:arylsulfatase A